MQIDDSRIDIGQPMDGWPPLIATRTEDVSLEETQRRTNELASG